MPTFTIKSNRFDIELFNVVEKFFESNKSSQTKSNVNLVTRDLQETRAKWKDLRVQCFAAKLDEHF